MLNGSRPGRQLLDGNDEQILPLVGDGLLPADVDGKQKPKTDTAIPLGRRRTTAEVTGQPSTL